MSVRDLLSRAWRRFFEPQPQQPMVVCRIGFGLVLFACYASKLPWVPHLFGPDGIDGWATHQRTPLPAGRPLEAAFQWLHLVPSVEVIWGLWAVLVAASLAFAIGAFTRWSGAVAIALHTLFHARTYYAFDGWSVMIVPWTLYVLGSDAGRHFSFDAWLRRRRGEGAGAATPWLGPAWPVRLLQVHLCALYAVAGGSRLSDPGWLGGEMVFELLNDRMYGRLDVDWFPLQPILAVASYGVFVLEPLAPVLLWIPRTRTACVLALALMHAGMETLANVSWWQPVMLTTLTVFLPWRRTVPAHGAPARAPAGAQEIRGSPPGA
jgi:hypothetical protein